MSFTLDLVTGAALAVGFVVLARAAGRGERVLLASGLLVAAGAYVWLGLEAKAPAELLIESAGAAGFLALGLAGIFTSLWWLCVGWAIHGVWDLAVPALANVGYMPAWYAAVCLGFDVVLALYIGAVAGGAIREPRSRERAAPSP